MFEVTKEEGKIIGQMTMVNAVKHGKTDTDHSTFSSAPEDSHIEDTLKIKT